MQLFRKRKKPDFITPDEIQNAYWDYYCLGKNMPVRILRDKKARLFDQDGYVIRATPKLVKVQIFDKLGSDFKRELNYSDFTDTNGFYIENGILILDETVMTLAEIILRGFLRSIQNIYTTGEPQEKEQLCQNVN